MVLQSHNKYFMTKHDLCKVTTVAYREKLGNGKHLSLEAYKYKENNIYVLIIMQHKEHIKFYPETHFYRHNFGR